jgi:uncharacterized protein DUF4484/DENN domain-containing protein
LILPSESLARLRSLFSVGIHDIPLLEELAVKSTSPSRSEPDENLSVEDDEQLGPQSIGWLACTTDEILSMKPKLYDIAVEMPSTTIDHLKDQRRPIIKIAGENKSIRATQRDWRRYKLLRRALKPLRQFSRVEEDGQLDEDHEDSRPLLLRSLTNLSEGEDVSDDEAEGVEPTSWSELAYSSFLWWASAGEQDSNTLEEETSEISLLGNLDEIAREIADSKRFKDDDNDTDESAEEDETITSNDSSRKDARLEMEIISYFHRITKNIFDVCSEVISNDTAHDDEDETGFDERPVPRVDRETLKSMGLDGWSAADRDFVRAFFELWFEREVHVDPLGVECCGLRIC